MPATALTPASCSECLANGSMTKRRLSSNVAFPCAAVPLTHSAGLVAHAPRAVAARAVHLLLYPFVGGRLHAIFHTLAWVSLRSVQCPSRRAAVMLLSSLCFP